MPVLLLGCRKLLINNMGALAHWNWRGPWRARLKGFNATILAPCPYPQTMQWRLWESLITAFLAPNLTILPYLFLPPKNSISRCLLEVHLERIPYEKTAVNTDAPFLWWKYSFNRALPLFASSFLLPGHCLRDWCDGKSFHNCQIGRVWAIGSRSQENLTSSSPSE